MKKMYLSVLAVMVFVSLTAGQNLKESTTCFYNAEDAYTDSVQIPVWARNVGVLLPTIGASTLDFSLSKGAVDGTGSPKYFTANLSFHCSNETVGGTSTTESGRHAFTVNLSTTADVLTGAGQGSGCYTFNSSSTTPYYAYISTTSTGYDTVFDIGVSNFSFGFSMKHNTASNHKDGVAAYISSGTANAMGWYIEMENDGDIAFTVSNVTGTDVCRTTAATYDDNAWHRVWCVKNTTNMKIYVDGVEIATRAISGIGTGTLTYTGEQWFYIGRSSSVLHFDVDGATEPGMGFAYETKAWEGSLDGITYFNGSAKDNTFIWKDYKMFSDAANEILLQTSNSASMQISSGTGLKYIDLTDELKAFEGFIRIKFGTVQSADRTFTWYFKD